MLYDEKWARTAVPVEAPLKRYQELLLRAADIIEEKGWARGEWQTNSGAVCLLGAMGIAHNGRPYFAFRGFTYRRARAAMARYLCEVEHAERLCLNMVICANWNDDDARSNAHVISSLRAAARYGV